METYYSSEDPQICLRQRFDFVVGSGIARQVTFYYFSILFPGHLSIVDFLADGRGINCHVSATQTIS